MTNPEGDIVKDLVRRARALHPGVPDMTWRRIEYEFRQEWGGVRVYVTKRAPAEREQQKLKR